MPLQQNVRISSSTNCLNLVTQLRSFAIIRRCQQLFRRRTVSVKDPESTIADRAAERPFPAHKKLAGTIGIEVDFLYLDHVGAIHDTGSLIEPILEFLVMLQFLPDRQNG